MDGATISLAKLWEDHRAASEAMHGLLGRVQLLEARVDYLEHGRQAARALMEKLGKDNPEEVEG